MVFVRKHFWEIAVLIGLVFLFFFTRFYNILAMPIFTDEAIYIRWAQIAKGDASWRFISLTDGKQPLFTWMVMIALKFIKDPLLAGRAVSVFAGFLSLIGLVFLGKEIFKNIWTGVISAFLYLIFPMALLYDRMALYDSLVGTFSVFGLYFAILLARKIRLDTALILGMTTGAAVLNKTSGFFTIYLIPFTLILLNYKEQKIKLRIFKWAALAILVVILTYAYYSMLRLSPFFHIIAEKNALFRYPFNEWIKHPFTYFLSNFKGEWNWFITYITWPVFILIITSFFIRKEYLKEKLLLFIWFLIPFTALALFGNTIYPRFIFFMILPLLALAGFTVYFLFQKLKNKILFASIFVILISLSLRTDFLTLTDLKNSTIHYSDLNQYNNDWPSGTGVPESIEFFKKEAEKGKIFVATQGTFGLMPYAYEIFLSDNKNITVKGFWPISDTVSEEVLEISQKMPTYFVFYQPCTACYDKGHAPRGWEKDTGMVLEIKKPSGDSYLTVYQIQPR